MDTINSTVDYTVVSVFLFTPLSNLTKQKQVCELKIETHYKQCWHKANPWLLLAKVESATGGYCPCTVALALLANVN